MVTGALTFLGAAVGAWLVGEATNIILKFFGRQFFNPLSPRDRWRFVKELRYYPSPLALLGTLLVFFGLVASLNSERISTILFLVIAIPLIIYSWYTTAKKIHDDKPKMSDLEIASKRLVTLVELQAMLARRNHDLMQCRAHGGNAEPAWTNAADNFMLRVSRLFVAEGEPIVTGISIYRPDPADPNYLKHWANRDVAVRNAENPNGLEDLRFFIGHIPQPKSSAGKKKLAERGLAGMSYTNGVKQATKITREEGHNGEVTFKSSNPRFLFDGGPQKDPGFASLITIPVPGIHGGPCAVLSIDSNRIEQFDDKNIVDLLTDLAWTLAVTIELLGMTEA